MSAAVQDPRAVTGFDVHSHKCGECNTVWTHERLRGVSDRRYERAHECPNCKEVQYLRHYGPDAAQMEPPERPTNPFQILRMLIERIEELEGGAEHRLEDLDRDSPEDAYDNHRYV